MNEELAVHHGHYYRKLLKRIGIPQRVLGDMLGLSIPGTSGMLNKEAWMEPSRRAKIEAFLGPEALSRGLEFESLLSEEQQASLMGKTSIDPEVQRNSIPVRETLILTFENGHLIDMKKPESEFELRAMMADMKTRIGEVMEELLHMKGDIVELKR